MSRFCANNLLLLAALFWGLGNVGQKVILEELGPFTALGVRCLFAALAMLPAMAFLKPPVAVQRAPDRKLLAVIIGLFAVANLLNQIGFSFNSVTNVGFLVNTTSVMTPVAAWMVFGQKPQLIIWPAAAASLAGTLMMDSDSSLGMSTGNIICLCSAACYSLWMILLGKYVVEYGQAAVLTLMQFVAAGLAFSLIGISFEPVTWEGLAHALPKLLITGVVSTATPYLLQAIAQQYTSATEASLIVCAEALFGALGGIIFLGEVVSFEAGFGAALVFLGILTAQISHSARVS